MSHCSISFQLNLPRMAWHWERETETEKATKLGRDQFPIASGADIYALCTRVC